MKREGRKRGKRGKRGGGGGVNEGGKEGEVEREGRVNIGEGGRGG